MAKQIDTTYGDALFELAKEENLIDSLYEEAGVLATIIRDNQELIELLNHPQIEKSEKLALIEKIFDKRVSKELTGLMVMVVEKDHVTYINDILNYFIRQVKKYKNIGIASVTSAIELKDSQRNDIEKRLLETTGYSSMEIEYKVDRSIIGGLVIRIEDRVVDSSIRTKLENMSKTLSKA